MSFDGKGLNKEYDQNLQKTAYQGYWQQEIDLNMDLSLIKKEYGSRVGSSQGSQRRKSHSVMVVGGSARKVGTPKLELPPIS